MKKQLLLTRMLLLVALLVGSSKVWAEETNIVTFTFSSHTGWTVNADQDTGKTPSYYLLIASDKYIDSPSVTWSDYTGISITVKARKYGGPSANQGKIYIKQGNTQLTTISPTSTTLSNYVADITPTGTGSIRIVCSDASNSKGCGVSEITITGTPATPHTLTFSATGGSIAATNAATSAEVLSGASVTEGTTLNIVATPNSGYTFTGWTSSPSATFGNASNASTTYVMPTADATLTANFEEDNTDYDITLNQTSGGTIEASATTAKSGTQITLTPTPDSGYRLVSWTVLDGDANEVTVTNNKFTMPASDVEVEGTFAREYTITINDAEHGSVTADPVAGIEDETITLTITPDANYSLNTISVKDADEGDVALSGTGNTRTFTMPAKAVTVTATFTIPKGSFANPYTVDEIVHSSISGSYFVRGYIVGDISNESSSVTTSGTFADSNLALATTPSANNTAFKNRDDAIGVQLPNDNILKTNNKLSTHTYLIGKEAIVYGNVENYFTNKKGVKSTKLILADNVMTLKGFGESTTSDIPGYSEDSNILYYTNSSVTGTNIIKEESSGSCSTTSALKITDGQPIRILSDVTVPSIENSRTLAADEDAYTWYEPYAYTLPEGNTAYTFTGASGTALTFTETGSQTLAANTPYLIVAADAVNGSVNSSTVVKATPTTDGDGGTQGNWQFVGTYKTMTASEAATANMWALGAGNKWFYYTGSDTYGVYPRRAYMINSQDKGEAKQFDSNFGDAENEVTHIELVNSKNPDESRIYTLDGKYVGTKKEVLNGGIYVRDGKKFVVK